MNEESSLEKLLTWFLHRRCYASCTEDLEEKMLEIALSLSSLSKLHWWWRTWERVIGWQRWGEVWIVGRASSYLDIPGDCPVRPSWTLSSPVWGAWPLKMNTGPGKGRPLTVTAEPEKPACLLKSSRFFWKAQGRGRSCPVDMSPGLP